MGWDHALMCPRGSMAQCAQCAPGPPPDFSRHVAFPLRPAWLSVSFNASTLVADGADVPRTSESAPGGVSDKDVARILVGVLLIVSFGSSSARSSRLVRHPERLVPFGVAPALRAAWICHGRPTCRRFYMMESRRVLFSNGTCRGTTAQMRCAGRS